MSEQEIKDMYPIGTLVNVKDNPYFFTGTVIGYHHEFITVRDQDDDHWDCFEKQLSLYRML